MTTKRELIQTLKTLKKEPRPLTPSECDELILLLGGTNRPNHRPVKLINGWNPRYINWGGLGALVFGFMECAEHLANAEAELSELKHPDYLINALTEVPEPRRADCERIGMAKLTGRILQLERNIKTLSLQGTAKTRADAIRLAVLWFKSRGISKSEEQIENELTRLQKAYGLKQLQLEEWRIIKARSDEACSLVHEAQALREAAARKKRADAIRLAVLWFKRRGGGQKH